jgi:hypothetical protein
MGVTNSLPGLALTTVLPISGSQAARISGVTLRHLATKISQALHICEL